MGRLSGLAAALRVPPSASPGGEALLEPSCCSGCAASASKACARGMLRRALEVELSLGRALFLMSMLLGVAVVWSLTLALPALLRGEAAWGAVILSNILAAALLAALALSSPSTSERRLARRLSSCSLAQLEPELVAGVLARGSDLREDRQDLSLRWRRLAADALHHSGAAPDDLTSLLFYSGLRESVLRLVPQAVAAELGVTPDELVECMERREAYLPVFASVAVLVRLDDCLASPVSRELAGDSSYARAAAALAVSRRSGRRLCLPALERIAGFPEERTDILLRLAQVWQGDLESLVVAASLA